MAWYGSKVQSVEDHFGESKGVVLTNLETEYEQTGIRSHGHRVLSSFSAQSIATPYTSWTIMPPNDVRNMLYVTQQGNARRFCDNE